jgi:hypothetical protein
MEPLVELAEARLRYWLGELDAALARGNVMCAECVRRPNLNADSERR